MKKAFDFYHDSRFVFSTRDVDEMIKFAKKYMFDGGWEKRDDEFVWDRTVDGLKETAKIFERKWSRVETDERRIYSTNRNIRKRIDNHLKKLAILQAQMGTGQLSDEETTAQMNHHLDAIIKIDDSFLSDD